MSEAAEDVQQERIDALHRRMAENSLGGHWQTRERDPELRPFVWSWESIYSCLMESGEVIRLGHIDEAAKRRTVNLVNPGLTHRKATSRTLQMSVQLVKPGEMAECHRHTAAALRFVVEGDGTGYTNVEGEQMLMEPGDLVLTPHWTWHDHQNPGKKQLVWLDVLDVHLANFLDANIHENYQATPQKGNYFGNACQPVIKPDGYCRRRLGPVRARVGNHDGRAMPFTYKWADTLAALEHAQEAGEIDPRNGVLLEYANPLTGGPTMPTIACQAQLIPPGMETRPQRHTGSTIFHVVRGEGTTTVGNEPDSGDDYRWGLKDCFFVPSLRWHRFRNTSKSEPAILFSVTDRPVLESLGLYREEGA